MRIIVHQWAFPSSFEQLELLPLQEFVSDWYGEDIDPPARFALAVDGNHLWFIARRDTASTSRPGSVPGQFEPDLWTRDVAELFLSAPDSSRYWEFNLAPNGAWWVSAFGAPREALPGQAIPEGVETLARETEDSWCSMAKIPLAALHGVDLRHCKLAATFIIGYPEPVYATSALDLSGEPDFHRPMDFTAPILK